MAQMPQRFPGRARLDDFTLVHDRDAIRDLRNDREVVTHEDQAHAAAADESTQQRQHLRLGADIQSRRGFVRDEQ